MALSSYVPFIGLRAFIDDAEAAGRYAFTAAEAQAALGVSDIALDNALRRLKIRRRLATPRRGLVVIVPTEYRAAGAPPPSWFIDDLMRFLGQPYYVGLLSAAALQGATAQESIPHGASPQESMIFQVVTDRPTRPAQVGQARIEFHASRSIESEPTIEAQTKTGAMTVSTPEVTAFDLVKFSVACGGCSHVATVLSRLAEQIDPQALGAQAEVRPSPEAQRLGFLLDRAGHSRLADVLLRSLASRRYRPVLLAPGMPRGDATPALPWRVVPNL